MSRTEGPQRPQQLFIYGLMPLYSTTEAQGNHCGNKIHTHHFTFMKSLIWWMILIWNLAFFTGMKRKINPGVFKTKPSDLSQDYLHKDKKSWKPVSHTQNDTWTCPLTLTFGKWKRRRKCEYQIKKAVFRLSAWWVICTVFPQIWQHQWLSLTLSCSDTSAF